MTEKQKRFIKEYVITLNASESAIKAGYSKKTAGSTGCYLLKDPKIQAGIKAEMESHDDPEIAKADEVLKYLTSVMRGKSQSAVLVVEGRGDGQSRAKSVMKTPDETQRLKAGELLAKRYGLLTEKVEGTVAVPVVIHDDISED